MTFSDRRNLDRWATDAAAVSDAQGRLLASALLDRARKAGLNPWHDDWYDVLDMGQQEWLRLVEWATD